jgi:hypothetical protein
VAKRAIELNKANALAFLGQLYRNQRDALKEYISNPLDAWQEGPRDLAVPCQIHIRLSKHMIRVESFGYRGMDQEDFRRAMSNVADSIKKQSPVKVIGQLGIGLFAFSQFALKAIIYSKAVDGGQTFMFTLKKGDAEYDDDVAPRKYALPEPGVVCEFIGLTDEPTSRGSQLHPGIFRRYLADQFAVALRSGELRLSLWADDQETLVTAPEIKLEPIGAGFRDILVAGNPALPFKSELYFQPDGKGSVGLRHRGVYIIRDLNDIDPLWPDFEESGLLSGYVEGALDVDFLKPIPSRTDFDRDELWRTFTAWFQNISASIDQEVQDMRDDLDFAKLDQIQQKAMRIAADAFKSELLDDLPFLTGQMRKRAKRVEKRKPTTTPKLRAATSMKRQMRLGDKPVPKGPALNFSEEALDDVRRHSRFDEKWGIIRINNVNPHYKRFASGKVEAQIWYSALMIGKETISQYDQSGGSDDYLERLVSFVCEVQDKKAK